MQDSVPITKFQSPHKNENGGNVVFESACVSQNDEFVAAIDNSGYIYFYNVKSLTQSSIY